LLCEQVNCEGSEDAHIFLLDELCSALAVAEASGRPISESLLNWIKENLTSDIEDRFLADIPSDTSTQAWSGIEGMHPTLKARCEYNLDGGMAQIALDLVTLVSSLRQGGHSLLRVMCPTVRLLQIAERLGGGLEHVDALLGCPAYVFDGVDPEDFLTLDLLERRQV
jgi:hypothetical protein